MYGLSEIKIYIYRSSTPHQLKKALSNWNPMTKLSGSEHGNDAFHNLLMYSRPEKGGYSSEASLPCYTGSLFVCFVCDFTSQSTAKVMSKRPVNLATIFLGKLR